MKCETIVTQAKKEFQPVTLAITFESADDLRNLWQRTNLSWTSIRALCIEQQTFRAVREPQDILSTCMLWMWIDAQLEKRGLKGK